MDDALHAILAHWANFYLVTGTAAAALTGLQFVVQTLLASDTLRGAMGTDHEAGINAFGSPTVVHFTAALVVSALMCVPWHGYGSLRATLGTLASAALVYALVVLRRTLRQRAYVPVAEDWLFHVILPCAAYAAILAGAILLDAGSDAPLFPIAAATMALVCIGIHNAWDTVTYLSISAIAGAPPAAARPPVVHGAKRGRGHRR